VNLISGSHSTNGLSLDIAGVPHSRMHFDVKIEGMDVVQHARLSRDALRIVLTQFKASGRLQVKNVELSVPDVTERALVLERAEAVMREEII
jgi:hypothetical protein